jgi:rhodanese-related sulfurtransferase
MKKRNLIIVILPLMLILVLVIIKTFNKDNFSEDAIKIHELSLKQEHLMSLQQFKQLKEKDSNFVIIDLRVKEDFEKGTIPEAINIPFAEILDNKEVNDLSLKNFAIVLYSSDFVESSSAWIILSQKGFQKLSILDIPAESNDMDFRLKFILHGGNEILKYTFTPDSID